MLKKFAYKILLSSIFVILLAPTVYAVPPPDFLFSIGSQLVQVFSAVLIFFTVIFTGSYKYLKMHWHLIGIKRLRFFIFSILIMVGVSFLSAYFYGQYRQNQEYQKWLSESQQYANLPEEEQQYVAKQKIARFLPGKDSAADFGSDSLDQLLFGSAPKVSRESLDEGEKFESRIDETLSDPGKVFIEKYYGAIANHEFDLAYSLSKQSVDQTTFESWYQNTSMVTLDKWLKIDANSASVELTLFEGRSYSRYGVLITFKFVDEVPVQIANSQVRVLSEGKLVEKGNELVAEKGETVVFQQEAKGEISISNEDFQAKLEKGGRDFLVLDARENLEFENGNLPGSVHIRFADLRAGRWIELPLDKEIYVICWSGIRGKEVAEFLRSKQLLARYLVNGANGWVEWGGEWNGNIKFSEKYTEARYRKLFSTTEVKELVSQGIVLVDSREPWKFSNWHIADTFNIPILYTPTVDIPAVFAQVPESSRVVIICDDYLNCFDAKVTAVELEERGHEFLGRYNKPWEYE